MERLYATSLLFLVALAPSHCNAFLGILPTERTPNLSKNHHQQSCRRTLITALAKETKDKGVTREKKKIQRLDYNWKDQWYALTYADYVPNPSQSAETVPAAVFGNPLVLWRSEDNSIIYCADDVCPHRRAALTEGRVRNGKLECYYHGWQFQGKSTGKTKAGECTFIPQLATGASIPSAACLTMRDCRIVEGIVWVWMGDDIPTKDVPKQGDGLDPLTGKRDGFCLNNFQIDLPYDHSYLVENLLDPAHIPIR